jgi:hypothetical protein
MHSQLARSSKCTLLRVYFWSLHNKIKSLKTLNVANYITILIYRCKIIKVH